MSWMLKIAWVLLAGTSCLAETITVCPRGCDHSSVISALDAATSGDVIEIAAGTYVEAETIDPRGKAVTLRGAMDPDGRPITVLDGAGDHAVLLCIGGEGPSTRFENIVVRNGFAMTGGGLGCVASSPSLANCRFEGNQAIALGGAMWNYFGEPSLVDCVFVENRSAETAGAMYNGNSRPHLLRCVFRGNSAARLGGGIANFTDSRPLLQDCRFEDNVALEGGGVFNFQSDPTLQDCDFVGNSFLGNLGESFGGAMVNQQSSPSLLRCIFVDNYGEERGGAMANLGGSEPRLEICVFSGNETSGLGPSIHNEQSLPSLIDCVFEECCQIEPPTSYLDGGGNQLAIWCEDCPENLDCRGDAVGAGDLGVLLGAWKSGDVRCDLDRSGEVDGADVGLLFMAWGPCGSW